METVKHGRKLFARTVNRPSFGRTIIFCIHLQDAKSILAPAELLPESAIARQAGKLLKKYPDNPNLQRMLMQITNPKVRESDKQSILALMHSEVAELVRLACDTRSLPKPFVCIHAHRSGQSGASGTQSLPNHLLPLFPIAQTIGLRPQCICFHALGLALFLSLPLPLSVLI